MCFWESWHFWERVAAPSKRSLTQISKIFRPKLGYFGTCISYSIPIRLLILPFFYLFIFNSRLYLLWPRTASKSPSKNGKIVLGKKTCGMPYFGWMDLFCLLREFEGTTGLLMWKCVRMCTPCLNYMFMLSVANLRITSLQVFSLHLVPLTSHTSSEWLPWQPYSLSHCRAARGLCVYFFLLPFLCFYHKHIPRETK